jgi:hypothetical protein
VKKQMDGIPQQPNQWIQGEAESQSAIMLAQHTTYFLKYKLKINQDGSQEMECQEVLDFVEPYNPDYPLAYLKGGQKVLAAMSKAQSKAYDVASKILSNLDGEQTEQVKNATGKQKYDLIAQYLSQDSASNLKYCVDYFNHFSRRKQSLISGSRTSGQNPQQMRQFRSPIEPISGYEEQKEKKGFFK